MPLLIKHGVLIEKTSGGTRHVVVIAEMRGGGGELRRGDDGPYAIETEYTSTYVKSAEISTKLSDHLRDLGYAAMAHHKGGDDIIALPALYASGFGELGRRGGLDPSRARRKLPAGFCDHHPADAPPAFRGQRLPLRP